MPPNFRTTGGHAVKKVQAMNLKNRVSIIIVAVTIFSGWWHLIQAVKVLEDARIMQRLLYQARVLSVDRRLDEMHEDLRELRAQVNRLMEEKQKGEK